MVINKKKTLYASIIIVILVITGGTLYLVDFALASKPTSRDIKASYEYLFDKGDYMRQWVDSLRQEGALRDTFVHSQYDGLKLHALYIKSPVESNKTALIVHGYTDNAVRMLMIGHLYNKELGYNIILPDLSAHGESGGDWIRMGWLYRHEIHQWIDVARDIFGEDSPMVIHGISMGAATTMMVSGDPLPNTIKCFVADCGYTSVWDQFKYQLKRDFNIPAFPLLYTANKYCDYKLGWNFREASSLKQVRKSEKPIFFIHGDSDTYVPTYMVHELFDAKTNGDKEKWVAPGVAHADTYWDFTEEYVEKVRSFVGKYI